MGVKIPRLQATGNSSPWIYSGPGIPREGIWWEGVVCFWSFLPPPISLMKVHPLPLLPFLKHTPRMGDMEPVASGCWGIGKWGESLHVPHLPT